MVGDSVVQTQQGIAYGLGQSASSLGGGVGSLIGGGLAQVIGLKQVFGVSAGLFIFSSLLTSRLLIKRSGKKPAQVT